MINAILIDYEFNAHTSLKWEIELFCPEVTICKMCSQPLNAIQAINTLKPDCVFLDIETPQADIYALLEQLNFKDFDLIITTTYTHYESNLFSENTLEYVLKPIDRDDLIKVMHKVEKHKNDNSLGNALNKTIQQLLLKK